MIRVKEIKFYLPAVVFSLLFSLCPLCSTEALDKIVDYYLYHPLRIDQVIYFDTSKDTIKETSIPDFRIVAEIMKGNPKIKSFRIEGYTDSHESKKDAQKLSLDRANKVILFLMDAGVPKSRLTPVGKGPDHPMGSNDTAEGRAKNRRVEIEVVHEDEK